MSNKDIFKMRCEERDDFEKKMFKPEIVVERDGFTLQRSTQNSTGKEVFKLLWDGVCISLLDDEAEARKMFEDFAPPAPKKRGRPAKAA